jgi:oligogalacturonide lyase
MRVRVLSLLVPSLLIVCATGSFGQADSPTATPQAQTPPKTQTAPPPKTWIDADTGRRVTRLSDDANSKGFYFDENAYTPDGQDMIYTSPKGIYDLNLSTLKSSRLVIAGMNNLVVGTRTRRVFFEDYKGYYYATDIDTKLTTRVLQHPLPPRAHISSVNADETLLVGTVVPGIAPEFLQYKVHALEDVHKALVDAHQAVVDAIQNYGPTSDAYKTARAHEAKLDGDWANVAKTEAEEKRFASKTPEEMFTVNLQTGEIKYILKGTDWLNHVQFSPTDPTLIMYAHEGPALKVDRIWTIRADGSENHLIHQRTNPNEIVTHEFWSRDGKTIWFDLQKSKGKDFAVGGYEVETGKDIAHPLKRDEASVHYNVAFDGSVFCGDGRQIGHGDVVPGTHEHATVDRKWIELIEPLSDGTTRTTRLAHLSAHDYAKTEPNTRFTPDNRRVIFTSNMFGPTYVFAVDVDKAADSSTAQATGSKAPTTAIN